jgi:hypothetical protein
MATNLPFNSPTQYSFDIGVESDVGIQRPVNKNHEWYKIDILYFILVFGKLHCSYYSDNFEYKINQKN